MYCYYSNNRRKRKLKRVVALITVLSVIILLYFYFQKRIITPILDVSYSKIGAYSVTAVNNATLISLSDEINYSDLVLIEKDNAGNIVLLSANSLKINKLSREVASNSQMFLNEYCDKGIDIPLGTFFGIKLFSGSGKNLNLDIISISKVICEFVSEFKSVGINQTLHSIYINVMSEVDVVIPLAEKKVKNVTEILVCEAVLMGKIPDIYLNDGLFK